ncbi:recombination regulator RecX [Alteribacillus sp. HJP-4]|uniref:recombination regulator RecX n=1 Tax=Alteribacillus sp. HJP-4 TaxID=2775394 RepID=UPI0035CCDB2E
MKISKITAQKKRTDRFNVYFFDETGKDTYGFSVDEGVLVKWKLRKGMDLSQEDIDKINGDDLHKKALNAAITYLSSSMRTEHQIRHHLLKKEFPEDAVQAAVNKMKEYKFINDREFAAAFVRTKINTTEKGPVLVKEDLYQKGVPAEEAEEALLQYTEEIQLEKAVQILQKKGKKKAGESSKALKNRLLQMLIRKGFNNHTAHAAWETAGVETSDEQEWNAIIQHGQKAVKKWNKKYEGKTLHFKIKEHLYRKSFSLSMIDDYLREFPPETIDESEGSDEYGEKIQSDDGI